MCPLSQKFRPKIQAYTMYSCSRYFHRTSCIKSHVCCNKSGLSNSFPKRQVDRSNDFIVPTDSLTTNHLSNAVSFLDPIVDHQESQPLAGCSDYSALASLEADLIVQDHDHDIVTLSEQPSSEALTPTTSLATISSLNPNAPQFRPTSKQTRQNKKTGPPSAASTQQEKAEIESLRIQLSYSKTKISQLELETKEKDQSIKIYLQKLKLLEAERNDNYRDQYLHP